jgi:hypothetical protein
MRNRLVTRWSSCRDDTASGEPASTTDQQPALESAGLSGQVESCHPSLPSSREKVGGGTVNGLSRSPHRVNEWAVVFSYAH